MELVEHLQGVVLPALHDRQLSGGAAAEELAVEQQIHYLRYLCQLLGVVVRPELIYVDEVGNLLDLGQLEESLQIFETSTTELYLFIRKMPFRNAQVEIFFYFL